MFLKWYPSAKKGKEGSITTHLNYEIGPGLRYQKINTKCAGTFFLAKSLKKTLRFEIQEKH
jgi:hypothetical protein